MTPPSPSWTRSWTDSWRQRDPDSERTALCTRSQFNAIDTRYACKIDLIVRRDRPFSHEEFARRVTVAVPFAKAVPIVTPEDAILSKLEWAWRPGDSEKQLADAAGVLDLNPSIDRAYIDRWAGDLGVSDLWLRMSRRGVSAALENICSCAGGQLL